jgi:Protein of unknown function (DUF2789)
MDTPSHRFSDLFAQLGLSADVDGIARFLAAHAPLAGSVKLADAPFWTPAQAALLREAVVEDSDWAGPVDQLDQALRAGHGRQGAV